jgi:GT2 family glycosyltransferase
MKLSVVVVNCNEKKLLKQALISVVTAAATTALEIIVFDNASNDGSVQMLSSDLPEVKILHTGKRETYTRAANQALAAATGDYVLLMSPTVLLSSDTLQKTLKFMDEHPATGALGVRMINGAGRFLPESKHGLPAAWVKFFKYVFLFRFFPKLRLNQHTSSSGWTEEFDNSEVDVLCRNFTLFRKSVLNKVGLFDERFAYYGQDIDLSYRIRLADYKNYYYAKTHVVNYNTSHPSKLSWKYLKHYYGAMFTFATKYLFKMPAISLGTGKPVSASLYELER